MQELLQSRSTCGGSPLLLLTPLSDGQQLGCAGPGSEAISGDTFPGPVEQSQQTEVELDF